MPLRELCTICKNKGYEIFSMPYSSQPLVNLLYNYYGKNKNVDTLINKISKNFFSILKCESCNFAWQSYSLDHNDQKFLYDKIINQDTSFQKSLYLEQKDKDYQIRELNFFQCFFKRKSNLTILDFGAGWGGWLKNIRTLNKNIFALEFSENKIKILEENKINVLSLESLLNKNLTFDFIRLEQVLEHIDDLESVLKLLKKITNNNSIIYISVPNSNKLLKKKIINKIINKGPMQPLEHLNSFTPYSLNKLFLKHNFKKLSLVTIVLAYIRRRNYGFLNFKYLLKLIYNYFFTTTLLFRKNNQ